MLSHQLLQYTFGNAHLAKSLQLRQSPHTELGLIRQSDDYLMNWLTSFNLHLAMLKEMAARYAKLEMA